MRRAVAAEIAQTAKTNGLIEGWNLTGWGLVRENQKNIIPDHQNLN